MQHINDPITFRILLQVGLENVLYIHRIGGDDYSQISSASDKNSVCGVLDHKFGCPFEQSMAVFEKIRQGSNKWIGSKARGDAVV
ncbi:hypothetical protein MRB53_001728 [Persea americana]|uniref:Uncharacterized protein n=1 Tax=Persea americana TaxID=3435 RepID=A0ACC2MSS4_PERAE|nr:hypothetical protein MRB53_001728 [Persea americana]